MEPILRRNLRDINRSFLLAILILFSFGANAQIWNPSIHVTINDAMGLGQAAPLDGRTMYWDGFNFVYRDFQNPAEVLTYLPTTASRFGHAIIAVDSGGTLQSNGTYTNPHSTFYMFRDSTTNGGLVKMNLFGTSGCVGCLLAANNLSDLSSASTARSNLGLGAMATLTSTAASDLSGTWPIITVAKFNGQLPSYYLNYTNLTNTPPLVSLTTIGTSGVATYNSGTGVLNIPNYTGGGGGSCINCNADTIGHIPLNFVTFCNGCVLTLDSVAGTASWQPSTGGVATIPPNIGTGFRIYSPQVPGFRSIICGSGCNLDSTSNTNALTLNITSGGTGTVTAFTAGNFSPLFTTSVANGTTTPALTFNASTFPALNILINPTGSPAAPIAAAPTYSILNSWSGGTIALLGNANVWTALNTFNSNVTMGSQLQFAANNTYSVGSITGVAAHVWSRIFESDASVELASTTGNSAGIYIGTNPGITLLATGQGQLNNYTTSTSFTGTATSILGVDASGDIIQLPSVLSIGAVQGLQVYGTTGDSIGLGGFFFKPDTLDLNYYALNLLHVTGKATVAGSDSVLIRTSVGQVELVPTGAIGGGGGTPGGSNTQVQFNNSGAFGGSASLTWNGSVLATSGLALSGNVTLNATNTYSIGALADELSQVYTANISANSSLALSYGTTGALTFAQNGVAEGGFLNSNQFYLNSYIGNVFAGTVTGGTPDSVVTINDGKIYKVPFSAFGGGGGGGGGIFLVGPIDSAAGIANGLRVNGTSIYAQSASTTVPGMVNLKNQTFRGAKSFDSLYANNNLTHFAMQSGDSTFAFTHFVPIFGTSISCSEGMGYGNSYYGTTGNTLFLPIGWAQQFAHDLGMQQYTLGAISGNMAISGTTLVKVSTGDSSMVDRIVDSHVMPVAGSLIPYIVFEYGTNDARNGGITKAQFYSAVIQVTDTALAHGFTLNHIIWVDGAYSSAANNLLIRPFDTTMLHVCDSLGVPRVDVWAAAQANGGLINVSPDSVHPNNRGHYIMEKEVIRVIDSIGLARVGRVEAATAVIHNDACIGCLGPWTSTASTLNNQYRLTVVNGDILIAGNAQAGIDAGFGLNQSDSTSTVFAFTTLSAKTTPWTGINNTLIGWHSGGPGTTESLNTAVGYKAMSNATSAQQNTALGASALLNCTSCGLNTAVGLGANGLITTGANNSVLGYQAMLNNTTGGSNTVFGYQAALNYTQSQATVFGASAYTGSSGGGIAAFGYTSLGSATTGVSLTAVGASALKNNTTGSQNVGIGTNASLNTIVGNNDVFIGFNVNFNDGVDTGRDVSNSIAIGDSAMVGCSYCAVIGGPGSRSVRFGTNLTNPQAMFDIPQGSNVDSFASLHITYNVVTTTTLSGTGSVMTIGFATQIVPPYLKGGQVIISGATPSGYNGTWTVLTCTRSSMTLTGTGTGAQTGAGTVEPNMIPSVFRNGSFYLLHDTLKFVGPLTGTVYNLNFPGAGSTPNLQTVLTAGSTLTTNNTISFGSNTLNFTGTGTTTFSGFVNMTGGSGSGASLGVGLLFGNSSTPTTVAGTGAGTSPSITVSGNDLSGVITITPGLTPAGTSANIVTISLAGGFVAPSGLSIVLYPANAATALLSGATMVYAVQDSGSPTTKWDIFSGTTGLTQAVTYSWNYHVISD